MNRTGEIITFQIGNYSNFVGAHFFNLQDPTLHPELENEFTWKAFWREGRDSQRQRVVTPRALIFDLKDNWSNKFIRRSDDRPDPKPAKATQPGSQNVLDTVENNVVWDGSVQRVVLANDISDSDADNGAVSSARNTAATNNRGLAEADYCQWGDFTRWRLHSTDKFAFRIPNFMYNSETEQLVSYGQGLDVFRKIEESVEDGIRLYAEECDYLEGFHLLVDENDGFTGVAGGILEHLGDEYDKKACLGLSLNRPLPDSPSGPATTLRDFKIRISNLVQLWSSFSHHARVFSSFGICEDILDLNPVSRKFTGILQNCESRYISSSILAATLDTLTAPYRLVNPSFPLHEMTSLLNAFGHKMTMISSAVPYPLKQQTLFKTLSEEGLSTLSNLAPNVKLNLEESLGNVFVVRGINKDRVISKSDSREYKHADINSVTSCFELFCQESYSRSVHVVKDISRPFKSSEPFPKLYDENVLDTYSVDKKSSLLQGTSWMLPAIVGAHNTPAVGVILERVVEKTGGGTGGSAMKMRSFYEPSSATCNSTSIEFEDYVECVNELSNLRESYFKE